MTPPPARCQNIPSLGIFFLFLPLTREQPLATWPCPSDRLGGSQPVGPAPSVSAPTRLCLSLPANRICT